MRTLVSTTKRWNYSGSDHTSKFLHPESLKKYADNALKIMKSTSFKKMYPEYDTLAFSGYSGALIAPILALSLGKDMVLVRKKGVECASSRRVEGYQNIKKYIIVDDFVCSGETAKRIITSIKEFAPEAKCLGVLSIQELAPDGYRRDLETVKAMND